MVLLIVGASMSGKDSKKLNIPSNAILKLNISEGLSDMPQNKEFSFGNNEDETMSASIYEVIDGIEKAKSDDNIKAMWIPLNGNSSLSYAQLDLLRKAIANFKTSKKPVLAYGEVVSQKMYYLACLADKLYVNPNGGMDIRGFGAQLQFFKNTLDKLEITPQIFYAGKFKSATEPLRLDKMSDENKQQTRELLSDISKNVITNIAKDRKLTDSNVINAINQMQSSIPNDALAAKLIDGEKYVDEVEGELRKMLRFSEDEKLNFTSIKNYISENEDAKKKGDIAVYVAEGDIIDGKSTESSIGSATVVSDLRKMAEDDNIHAVVLRINSPGGSALASAVMLREIDLLKKKKPVVVSMGNVAASGGYYIASSGNKIFAESNTITGSIGVFGIIPNIGNLLKNKLGVTFDEVELNDHAVMGINKEFEPLEAAKIQLEIENIYHTFKSVVSKGRGLSMDSVESIAQGRVWSGVKAKQIHLVDEIGGLKEAIKYASTLIKSNENSYYFFNRRKSDLERLLEDFSGKAMMSYLQEIWLKSNLGEYSVYFDMLKKFESIKGAQARMMYQVVI